jgi:hypothetical protein
MKKISTLFKKDPSDLSRVIAEVDPENAWALTEGKAYQKWDGTACAIIDGELYKRYDAKHGKPAPVDGIPCQDPDPISGHWPHWVKCQVSNPADRYHLEAFGLLLNSIRRRDGEVLDGTYELCGPKIKSNPERIPYHALIRHDLGEIVGFERTFDGIRAVFDNPCIDMEGIVFHHSDGRMCKIRKTDFGFKREAAAQ